MDPKNARKWLQIAATVLAVATAVITKLQSVDITSVSAIIGAVALTIGGMFGKASEAPGGVARWKIPEHLQKFIPK